VTVRSVELELKTVSEANARGHWRAGAARHAEQREVVRAVLCERFGAPPLFTLVDARGWTRPNPITIAITRLAPGELDADDNLPGALKYVKDEVAAWFGVTDRDRRLSWRYAQERTAPGIYKVRIEITDASPGADIRVQLASEPETMGARLRPLVRLKRGAPPPEQAALPVQKSYAALPWEQPDAGSGAARRLRPIARYEGLSAPPPWIEWRVPVEHLDRFPEGSVKLYRRRRTSRATGLIWVYERV
jgi:hypothetical protein